MYCIKFSINKFCLIKFLYQIHVSLSVYMLVTLPVYACPLLPSVNPQTDTVPHQVIPQYENVDMITNTVPTTKLEMNACAEYAVIKY